MKGHVLGIKKSSLLIASFFVNALAFFALLFVSIFLFKSSSLWFFYLCLFCGQHLLIKAMLFHLDSSCYFGTLLFLVGTLGQIIEFKAGLTFSAVYFLLAFAFASLATYCFFNQKFHLVLFIVFAGNALAWFFYKINFISLGIFIAICLSLVLLFVLKYLISNFAKRS